MKHPFHKSFDIEAYNTKWFDDDFQENIREAPNVNAEIDDEAIFPDTDVVTSDNVTPREETDNSDSEAESEATSSPVKVTEDQNSIEPPSIEDRPIILSAPDKPRTVDDLQMMLAQSEEKKFFIQYVPGGTLRPRWYVVQVNEAESSDSLEKGIYLCEFLQRHTSDEHKSDSRCRWWPEWRELLWSKDGSEYEYGRRVLLSPRSKPDLQKYGKFSDNICLLDEEVYLAGPFDFAKKDASTPAKSVIPEERWKELQEICESRSIIPPSIGGRSSRRGQADTKKLRENLPELEGNMYAASSLNILEHLFSKKGGRGSIRNSGNSNGISCAAG